MEESCYTNHDSHFDTDTLDKAVPKTKSKKVCEIRSLDTKVICESEKKEEKIYTKPHDIMFSSKFEVIFD